MSRWTVWRLILLAALAGAGSLAIADDRMDARILTAIRQYNALASLPLPVPERDQLERIARGANINLRERTSLLQSDGQQQDRIRVVGYQLVPYPRLLVWLATLDFDTQHNKRLTEYLMDVDDVGGSVWYQYLNTPWPVRNRHWVIRNTKTVALEVASQGRIWEHSWRLASNGEQIAGNLLRAGQVLGLDAGDGDNAIYLSVNRGAWTMMAIDENTTLVAAHTVAVMGGWIPESWVARFVGRQLGGVLRKLETRSNEIHERYTARYPVFTGAGVKITPQMAAVEHDRYVARQGARVSVLSGPR